MIRHLTSKLALVIYAIAAIALSVWGYTVFKKQYSSPANSNTQTTPQQPTASNESTTPPAAESPAPESASTDNVANPSSQSTDSTDNSLVPITPQICESQCAPFKYDPRYLDYCRQVCGLAPDTIPKNGETTTSCDKLTGLKKDYCFKDQAISKSELPVCDKIIDTNIKKTCKNRITQDLLESQY